MAKVDLTGKTKVLDFRRIKRFFGLLSPRLRRNFVFVLCVNFFAALLEMGGLGLLPLFINVLSTPDRALGFAPLVPVYAELGVSDATSLAIFASATLVAYFLLKTLYTIFALSLQARYMKDVMVYVGRSMFEKYLYAPYAFHLNAKSADIINNVTYVPQYFGVAVILPLLQVFLYSLMVVGSSALLFVYNPLVASAALLLPGIASGAFILIMRQRSELHGRALSESLAHMIAEVSHAIGSIKETHLRGCQSEFIRDFSNQIDTLGRSFQFQKSGPNSAKPIIEFFGILALVVVIVIFLLRGDPISAALPTLALFVVAIARIIPNLHSVTTNVASLRTYAGLIDRIHEEVSAVSAVHVAQERLGLPASHKKAQASANAASQSGSMGTATRQTSVLHWNRALELKNVSYTYPNVTEPALKDVSISIPYRSAVAFVGASGAGKSTLVDVILGLVEAQTGTILADGTDIYSNLRAWQNNIGYIPQTIYLLDGSVRRNVAFGVPRDESDDQKVWEALRMAHLDAFVRSLPGQLDAQVGERGIRFSGGQRQRVGIARALYNQPDLLIMDEATSALDTVTEQAVIREISQFKNSRTIIMVAHRMTTVADCDVIFLLEGGRIAGRGSFSELVAKSPDFRLLAQGVS